MRKNSTEIYERMLYQLSYSVVLPVLPIWQKDNQMKETRNSCPQRTRMTVGRHMTATWLSGVISILSKILFLLIGVLFRAFTSET